MSSNRFAILTWLCCLSLLLYSCRKKHDPLYGEVTITGQVVGIDTNEPIPNAIVEMYNVVLRSGPFGGQGGITTGLLRSDTTDALGNYSIQFTATGQYELEIVSSHNNRRYVNANFERINRVGHHLMNFECYRSAIAKIILTNVPPIDTPYGISLRASESIVLRNFYKDTVLHLKLVGKSLPTTISYSCSKQSPQEFTVTPNPWDTVTLYQNY